MDVHSGGGLIAAVEGKVQRGDRRGRLLGFPTANVHLSDDERLDGVYAGTCRIGTVPEERQYVAAVSVSNRPTFYGTQGMRLLEAHLLGFNGDLYDMEVRVELLAPLRSNQKFHDASALVDQLREDVRLTRSWAVANGLEPLLGQAEASPTTDWAGALISDSGVNGFSYAARA